MHLVSTEYRILEQGERMAITNAKQEHATLAGGSGAARNNPGDEPASEIKGATPRSPAFGAQMPLDGLSPDERRKTTADWLITWLKEGDAQRKTCSA